VRESYEFSREAPRVRTEEAERAMKQPQACAIDEVEFEYVRNKNEARVIASIPRVVPEFPGFTPNRIDFEDIYALALNNLPARYVQHINLVLEEPVTDEMILEAIRKAISTVTARPNH
jgi:hypothetical protein